MEEKTNAKVERVLSLVEPGRREALRKILTTAAYTAPVISSFSLDALAGSLPSATCLASNQTCVTGGWFRGKVNCDGFSVDRSSSDLTGVHVHVEFDVAVWLCEGLTGGIGAILNGPSTLAGATEVGYSQSTFGAKNSDTLGFAVSECSLSYFETGQWKHETPPKGPEKLKGDSQILIIPPDPINTGTAYTLDAKYDLTKSS